MQALLWAWLLPALALLPGLWRLTNWVAAYRRGLVRPRAWRWLLAALAGAVVLPWLAQASVVYRNRLEMPLAALAAVGVMAGGLRAAGPGVHPGLRGLRRRVPRDGLELVERATTRLPAHRRLAAWLRPLYTLLPALLLLAGFAAETPNRWLDFALVALLLPAPLLLVAYRWQWLLPLGLALPAGVLLGQALAARAALPPGWWAQPVTGAHCPGAMRVAEGRAWCADLARAATYGLDLATGQIVARQALTESARVFAANGAHAWVQQIPARGLVRVGGGEPVAVRVTSAQSGAADRLNQLWVVDVSRELTVYAADGTPRPLRAADGLLNNTATSVKVSPTGDVWVGSISGASVLRAGSTTWQVLDRDAGVPGAVLNLTVAPDGAVWFLWQPLPGYGARSDWAVSALQPDGTWLHMDLGPQTGLEAPLAEDALAVDGQGRVWFVTQSIPQRERYLGVAAPGEPAQVYSLGPFPASGPFAYGGPLWRDTYGVHADGTGGIVVYAGPERGWWTWRK